MTRSAAGTTCIFRAGTTRSGDQDLRVSSFSHCRRALGLLLLLPAVAVGQPGRSQPDPAPTAAAAAGTIPWTVPNGRAFSASGLPPALQFTLESLGASTGVPDGIGYSWYPDLPVRGQSARIGLTNYQAGLTAPVYTSDTEGLFINTAVRRLDVRNNAFLPVRRAPFPEELWDPQVGGAYVAQIGGGWSWGVYANVGSASDKPFHSLAEMTVAGLAFLRVPQGERDGWLFYVVSTTSGQIGHNIPIPGVAYEFQTDRLSGVVGFPFVNLTYRPIREIQCEFNYAALTDVLAQVSYFPLDNARFFVGFEWTNQSWFRAERRIRDDQLFWYEKRAIGGLGWRPTSQVDLRLTGGYAFDRYFVENNGFTLSGRNRVDLSPGPFVAAQIELKY
ncbi:MAG: hypothetical protein JWO38_2283 [Gemmataceae bacterium]|nr:hypothetical protein [Gemmataceae bacterium]